MSTRFAVTREQLAEFQARVQANSMFTLAGNLDSGTLTAKTFFGDVQITYSYAGGELELAIAAPEGVQDAVLAVISKYLTRRPTTATAPETRPSHADPAPPALVVTQVS